MPDEFPITDTGIIEQVMPRAKGKLAELYAAHLSNAMFPANIVGVMREAAFLAQIAHESGELHHTKEIWGPSKWQEKYEGHKGLGNVLEGDGKRFMGRGLIQLTGRFNYQKCSRALFNDLRLLDHPELLEEPEYAALSATWYWNERKINDPADKDDFTKVTERINPGLLGLEQRKNYYILAVALLRRKISKA
ncbi:putative chitinase [Gammaproteobacteria bacterium]